MLVPGLNCHCKRHGQDVFIVMVICSLVGLAMTVFIDILLIQHLTTKALLTIYFYARLGSVVTGLMFSVSTFLLCSAITSCTQTIYKDIILLK